MLLGRPDSVWLEFGGTFTPGGGSGTAGVGDLGLGRLRVDGGCGALGFGPPGTSALATAPPRNSSMAFQPVGALACYITLAD